jgi:hypothetical protein
MAAQKIRSPAFDNRTHMQSLAEELIGAVDSAAAELRAISDTVAARKPRAEVWSVKEILGHLIDSAANNHQRFIRAQQVTELSFPGYEQDAWVRLQDYQHRHWSELVDLWVHYNHHLAHVIQHIVESAADVPCRIGGNQPVSLRWLVEDYLVHLRHHLKQIQERQTA